MQQLANSIYRRRGIGPGVLAYGLDISKPDGPGELGCVAATGEIVGFAHNTGRIVSFTALIIAVSGDVAGALATDTG